MFDTLKPRQTAAQACAQTIRRVILTGELAPGERLPPERELAERLGVTRVTLRQALGQLASSGLLQVRQGSGYRVQDFRQRGGPDLLLGIADLARTSGDLTEVMADLLLVRRHLARAVLERIAAGDSDGVQGVRAAVDAFGAVVAQTSDLAAIAAADLEVVRALLRATDSPVLALCFNPVLAVVTELRELRQAIYSEPATNVAGYQLLTAWLVDRRADAIDDIVAELARRDRRNLATWKTKRQSNDEDDR